MKKTYSDYKPENNRWGPQESDGQMGIDAPWTRVHDIWPPVEEAWQGVQRKNDRLTPHEMPRWYQGG